MGRTTVDQTYFLAVPSDSNLNFLRIRVHADGELGESNFRSGWFPADAVDSLYGDVSDKGATDAFRIREQIKSKYDAAALKALDGYLAVADDAKADPALVQSWLIAMRRVRVTASEDSPLPRGAQEVEYDPGRDVTTFHAGEKLVLVFSSDPTNVIAAISSFSSDVQTSATVQDLADVIRQRSSNEIVSLEAQNSAKAKTDSLIGQRLDALSSFLKTNPKQSDLSRELEALRILLENYQ
jgi:hypothetical protein